MSSEMVPLAPEEINARWERAWAEASEFERRRYRSLDWKGQMGTLMLVADGSSLGEAIKEAAPYAGDWEPPTN